MDRPFRYTAKNPLLLVMFLQSHFDVLSKKSYHLPTPKRRISLFSFPIYMFQLLFLVLFHSLSSLILWNRSGGFEHSYLLSDFKENAQIECSSPFSLGDLIHGHNFSKNDNSSGYHGPSPPPDPEPFIQPTVQDPLQNITQKLLQR